MAPTVAASKKRKATAPKKNARTKKKKTEKLFVPEKQEYIEALIKDARNTVPQMKVHKESKASRKETVQKGSAGSAGTNPAMKRNLKPLLTNNVYGRKYTDPYGLPPIVRSTPIAVTDSRQLLLPRKNNKIPNELGITNTRMPAQEFLPTKGGYRSGRL